MFLLTIILLLAALVSSSPMIKRQGPPGVWACADVYWSGSCAKYIAPYGNEYCNDLGPLTGIVSSIGPDEGLSCNFYDNGACLDMGIPGADMIELTYPGVANLVEMGWNDNILAYNCVPTSAPDEKTNVTMIPRKMPPQAGA